MGVKGLWKLLLSCSRKVQLKSLEGLVLAIDIHIWLNSFVKAMRLSNGDADISSILLGIYQRIIKLLYWNIKPIFVFDGPPPKIKRMTIRERRKRRSQNEENLSNIAQKLLLHRMSMASSGSNDSSSYLASLNKSQNEILLERKKRKEISRASYLKIVNQYQEIDDEKKNDPKFIASLPPSMTDFLRKKSVTKNISDIDLYSKAQLNNIIPEAKFNRKVDSYRSTPLGSEPTIFYKKNIKTDEDIINKIISNSKMDSIEVKSLCEDQMEIWRCSNCGFNNLKLISECAYCKSNSIDTSSEKKYKVSSTLHNDILNERSSSYKNEIDLNKEKALRSLKYAFNILNNQKDSFNIDMNTNHLISNIDSSKNKEVMNYDILSIDEEKGAINMKRSDDAIDTINIDSDDAIDTINIKNGEDTEIVKLNKENTQNDSFITRKSTKNSTENSRDEDESVELCSSQTGELVEDTSIDTSITIQNDLEREYRVAARNADSVSSSLVESVKKIIKSFGLPFLEAPAEAEAQCATLELLGLVNGIVSDDSDIFLFGASSVYTSLFSSNNSPLYYNMNDIFEYLHLNRNRLIDFSLLVGNDYYEGIKGVGSIIAMEILFNFDSLETFFKDIQLHLEGRADFPIDPTKKRLITSDVINDKDELKFSWKEPSLDEISLLMKDFNFTSNQMKHDMNIVHSFYSNIGKRTINRHIDSYLMMNDVKINRFYILNDSPPSSAPSQIPPILVFLTAFLILVQTL